MKYPRCKICQELYKIGLNDETINQHHDSKLIISIDYFPEHIVDAVLTVMEQFKR